MISGNYIMGTYIHIHTFSIELRKLSLYMLPCSARQLLKGWLFRYLKFSLLPERLSFCSDTVRLAACVEKQSGSGCEQRVFIKNTLVEVSLSLSEGNMQMFWIWNINCTVRRHPSNSYKVCEVEESGSMFLLLTHGTPFNCATVSQNSHGNQPTTIRAIRTTVGGCS